MKGIHVSPFTPQFAIRSLEGKKYEYYGCNPILSPNNGHIGDERFVHCSEVVPSSEVEVYIYRQGGTIGK